MSLPFHVKLDRCSTYNYMTIRPERDNQNVSKSEEGQLRGCGS